MLVTGGGGSDASGLYDWVLRAYEHDPQMTHDAMRRVGAGAKACAQLLKWSRALALVHELQREFLDEIGDVLPGWLKRQRRQRKQRRQVEAELIVLERAALVARLFLGWFSATEREVPYDGVLVRKGFLTTKFSTRVGVPGPSIMVSLHMQAGTDCILSHAVDSEP